LSQNGQTQQQVLVLKAEMFNGIPQKTQSQWQLLEQQRRLWLLMSGIQILVGVADIQTRALFLQTAHWELVGETTEQI